MNIKTLSALTLTASLLLAGSAGSVQLTNFQINGQPYTPGMTITGATVDASGNYQLTLAGKLTYEAQDKPQVPLNALPVDTAPFSQHGGVPGLFVTDAQTCNFPKLQTTSNTDAAGFQAAITVPANEQSRCFPMFSFKNQLQTIYYPGVIAPVLSYGDFSYGVVMNLVSSADGSFAKTISVTPSQAGNLTLTYQLPDYSYAGGAPVSTYVAKDNATGKSQSFTLGRISSSSFAAVANTTPLTAKTLSTTLTTDSADAGKTGSLFAVAVLPSGQLYSRDSSGGWTLWDGASPFKAAQSGVTLGSHAIDVLKTPTDVSGLVGAQVYVGYGIGAADSAAYGNLLAARNYSKVYTVQ